MAESPKHTGISPQEKNDAKTKEKHSAHLRGEASEEAVQKFFERKGYRLCYRRKKIYFAEIDLVMVAKNGSYLFVEVKSVSRVDFYAIRVSSGQKQRLLNTIEAVSLKEKRGVELVFAFVDSKNKIHLFRHDEI